MKRILLFLLPVAVLAAGVQLVDQHQKGLGTLPQQQAITSTAGAAHRALCQ
jgi:hypothetical protein